MNRWFRLASAAVAMIMIANFQYAWTLFVKPLIAGHPEQHWKLSDVGLAFSIFIVCQTWLMPVAGWAIDKIGPRFMMTLGGLLCGAGWAMMSQANSLPALYTFYAAAGVGAALVYCGSMGVALKWFPDKRGLAAGITAAAFGSGTALFIPLIAHLLKSDGYKTTFLYTGLAQGFFIMCAAQFLRSPMVGEAESEALSENPARLRQYPIVTLTTFLGAFVGFLLRPAIPVMGQLPFLTVITRGTNLVGADILLKGAATESFNFMLAGAVLGAVLGVAWNALIPEKSLQRAPNQPGAAPKVSAVSKIRSRGEDFTPGQMLRTSHFYVMYLMMFVMGVGGLMVTANLAKLADTFKITAAALIFAASMNPIANGASRLSWGWVSDHIGRERTMVIAFLIQSAALLSVPLLAPGSDTAFIVCLAVVYFSWGEIYSLFPSLTADLFGSRNASANYGFLYSTKGAAAIVGGYLAPMLFEKTGSWSGVFYGGAIMTFCAAIMAIGLKKMSLPHKPRTGTLDAVEVQGQAARG